MTDSDEEARDAAADGGDGDDGHAEGDDHEPHREEFHEDPVGHTRAPAGMTVSELVDGYGAAGTGAASGNEAGDAFTLYGPLEYFDKLEGDSELRLELDDEDVTDEWL